VSVLDLVAATAFRCEEIYTTERFRSGTPEERLIGISFPPEELGILFKPAPFSSGAGRDVHVGGRGTGY
jgi:hypothetical protein